MLVVRTNESSSLKTMCLAVWRFLYYWVVSDTDEERRTLLPKPTFVASVWPLQPLVPAEILYTEEEEEGVDLVLGNQIRRELCDINDNHFISLL
jgi:hypothetical protein